MGTFGGTFRTKQTRIATAACAALLALSAAACSSTAGDKLHPVDVMKSVKAPGAGWSPDPLYLSDGDSDEGPEYSLVGGAVAMMDQGTLDENQVFPKSEVVAAWSVDVDDKNLDQACGEFASWTLATIKGSPGKADTSDGPAPKIERLTKDCLEAADASTYEPDTAVSNSFSSHTASKADGYTYATSALMVLSNSGRRLTASFVARA